MIEARYKRSLNHNYLSIMSDGAGHETYQARMLEANEIPGLLPCHLNYLDGRAEYCYEVSSKQPLAVIYGEREMGHEMVCRILRELFQVLKRLEEYLLDGSGLLLDKEFIFVNVETKAVSFCLVPHYSMGFSEAVHGLCVYLLNVIDNSDDRAVMLTYRLFRLSSDRGFAGEQLGNLLADEGVEGLRTCGPGIFDRSTPSAGFQKNLDNVKAPGEGAWPGGGRNGGEGVWLGGGVNGGEGAWPGGGANGEKGAWPDGGTSRDVSAWPDGGRGEGGTHRSDKEERREPRGGETPGAGRDRIKKALLACVIALDIALFGVCCVLFLDGRQLPGGFRLPSGLTDFVRMYREICLKLLGAEILSVSVLAVCLIRKLQRYRKAIKEKSRNLSADKGGSRDSCHEGAGGPEGLSGDDRKELEDNLSEGFGHGGAISFGEDGPAGFENDGSKAAMGLTNVWDEEFLDNCEKTAPAGGPEAEEESYGDTVLLTADLKQSYGYEERQDRSLTGFYGGKNLEFKIRRTPYLIGKLRGNVDAVIQDRSISRIHARIHEEDGKYYLTDLNSTNGTSHNGELLDAYGTVPIEPGDEVGFAGITLKFS